MDEHDRAQLVPKQAHLLVFAFVLSLLVIVGGIAATFFVGQKIDTAQRAVLQTRVENIAVAIDPSDIRGLSGSMDDLNNPLYQSLKQKMITFHAINTDSRFVYIMGLSAPKTGQQNPDTLFFYVDSESPTSPDYSPPGQIYTDTRPRDIILYNSASPYVDGPYSDSWGEWVSGYAPIKDPKTGEMVALVGMDIGTHAWHSQIFLSRVVVAFVSLLLIAGFLILAFSFRRSVAYIALLRRFNTELSEYKNRADEAETLARLGRFSFNVITGEFIGSKEVADLLGNIPVPETFSSFLSLIPAHDRERVGVAISEATHGKQATFTLQYQLMITGGALRDIISFCSVKRSSKGEAIRILGTIQDVTGLIHAEHTQEKKFLN